MFDRSYIIAFSGAIAAVIFLLAAGGFSSTESTVLIAVVPPLVFFAILLLFGEVKNPYSHERRYSAKLHSIHDGDTIKLDFHGRVESYRLQYIDTPELGQDGGEAAAAMLGVLLRFKYIEFSIPANSSKTYDRNLCQLYANGKDVGLLLLQKGYAWIDTRYYVPPIYIRAFLDAQENKRGLFQDGFPVHPQLYRERKKNEKARKSLETQAAESTLKKRARLLPDLN